MPPILTVLLAAAVLCGILAIAAAFAAAEHPVPAGKKGTKPMTINLDDTRALQSVAASLEKIAGALESLAESRRKKEEDAETFKALLVQTLKKYGLLQ